MHPAIVQKRLSYWHDVKARLLKEIEKQKAQNHGRATVVTQLRLVQVNIEIKELEEWMGSHSHSAT